MKRSNIFPRHSNYDLPTAIKGEGCYIIDDSGKKYIDGSGGAAVSCLGHSDNTIKDATINQIEKLAYAHTSFFSNEPAEKLANLLAKNCCKGGEWSIGIPGTVGGAIFMNAGYGDFSISKHLISVKVIDIQTLNIFDISKKDLSFKYRFSSFQKNKLIILSAKFYFEPGGDKDLITKVTKANLKKKTDSQPYHLPSFGSVFKNPDNYYAGKLIEESGLKGFKLGGAQVSTIHANFIVNHLNASSEEIYQLISLIQEKVQQKKGIFLHPEVRMIGF